jgi:hypothetical protein
LKARLLRPVHPLLPDEGDVTRKWCRPGPVGRSLRAGIFRAV